jgi:hypothetical protein
MDGRWKMKEKTRNERKRKKKKNGKNGGKKQTRWGDKDVVIDGSTACSGVTVVLMGDGNWKKSKKRSKKKNGKKKPVVVVALRAVGSGIAIEHAWRVVVLGVASSR